MENSMKISLILLSTFILTLYSQCECLQISKGFLSKYHRCNKRNCYYDTVCNPVTNECDCYKEQCRKFCEILARDDDTGCEICKCGRACRGRKKVCKADEYCNLDLNLCVKNRTVEEDMCVDENCPLNQRCSLETYECENITKPCMNHTCQPTLYCSALTNRCECLQLNCRLKCPFGFVKNEKGCYECQCMRCQEQFCRSDQRCNRSKTKCVCITRTSRCRTKCVEFLKNKDGCEICNCTKNCTELQLNIINQLHTGLAGVATHTGDEECRLMRKCNVTSKTCDKPSWVQNHIHKHHEYHKKGSVTTSWSKNMPIKIDLNLNLPFF